MKRRSRKEKKVSEAEARLREALVAYLCDGRQSVEHIRRMERLLTRELADTAGYEELADLLALYRADDAAGFVGHKQLEAEIRWVLEHQGFAGCP